MDNSFLAYYMLIFVAVITNVMLAIQVWSRRTDKGVVTFVVLALALAEWAICNAFEAYATDLATKYLFTQLSYIGIVLVPPAWIVFTLEYTNRQHWLTRRTLALLAIHPIAVLIFVATNPLHNLHWTSITLGTSAGYPIAVFERGILFWLHTAYSYVMMLIATILLVKTYWQLQGIYRQQITLLLVCQFAPWISNFFYVTELSPLPDFMDLTPIAFSVTGIAAGWSLLRYRLLDVMPIARDMVFDGIDDIVFVLDTKQQIVDMNRPGLAILKRASKDVIGKQVGDVFADQVDTLSEYAGVSRADAEIEVVLNGKRYWFKLKISPLQAENGDPVGQVVMLQNITQLKAINRELEATRDEAIQARAIAEEHSRLKSEFLSTMSHELRTPLNAIEGFTSIMLSGMGVELSPKAEDMVQRVSANSKRLLDLINDFLDLSRIESGRLELIREPISPRQLARKWENAVSVLAEEKDLAFVVTVDSDLPETIIEDDDALSKITINLLSNAFKFTHEGQVRLNMERENDKWKIIVSDTGIGVPAHAREYIFDEFRQVDGSSKRLYGGTGLGLSLVQKLSREMGGNVALKSELGVGSTFIVTLPLELPIEASLGASNE
ncbi:MAG: hypothetical protein CL607_26365 [Anaerolineaceae bacterium]|nr:hypothetical protein [Anaerolineaceae bacterium]